MNLSKNEIKILTVLQKYHSLSRKDLIKKTGINPRNISRYLKQIMNYKFASSEMKKISGTKTRESIITITSKGKKVSLDGIPEIEEKPTPKKITVKAEKYIEWKEKREAYIPPKKETMEEILKRLMPIVQKELEIGLDRPGGMKRILEKYKGKKPKELIEPKPLPARLEMKKEIRLLINLVLTHRKEEYQKYGYKSVSEIRSQIDTLIDQL